MADEVQTEALKVALREFSLNFALIFKVEEFADILASVAGEMIGSISRTQAELDGYRETLAKTFLALSDSAFKVSQEIDNTGIDLSTTCVWITTRPDAVERLGAVPDFLDLADQRSARLQIAEKYIGGWDAIAGASIDVRGVLSFPGDPDLEPYAVCGFRSEKIYAYDHALFAVVQPDGSFEVARLD